MLEKLKLSAQGPLWSGPCLPLSPVFSPHLPCVLGAVPHICQHTLPQGLCTCRFLSWISIPGFCMGHSPTSFRFLLKRFFSRKSPSFSNPWFLFKALPTMPYSICAFLLACHLSCPLECKFSKGRDFILFTAIVLCLKQSLEKKKQKKTRAWITHRRGSINTYWMSKKQTWIALKGPTAPSSLRQWENHRTKSHKILILVQVLLLHDLRKVTWWMWASVSSGAKWVPVHCLTQ